MNTQEHTPSILMLEHDQDDRFITSTLFNEFPVVPALQFVDDSNELFDYLDNCNPITQPFPSLILLNYHAVPMNGPVILQRLKANTRFRHIPVIVLSGSDDKTIARECYALGASSFIRKPDTAKATLDKISSFLHYWMETVEL